MGSSSAFKHDFARGSLFRRPTTDFEEAMSYARRRSQFLGRRVRLKRWIKHNWWVVVVEEG